MTQYPTKSYIAGGAIDRYHIVKFGADDDTVVASAAVGDALIGITIELDVVLDEKVDVVHSGVHQVKLGGTVTRGDLLTSDANGKAVAAAPAAGVNNSVIGRALASGVLDDIIPMVIAASQIQG